MDADSVMYEVDRLRSDFEAALDRQRGDHVRITDSLRNRIFDLENEVRDVRRMAVEGVERSSEAMRQAEFGYERRP